jgi:biopolymer transport protein TolR
MRKRRKISVRPQSRPKSDINITPLVDVVLVLLIIFMVMTPLGEKMLRVRVPDAEEVQDVRVPPPGQLVVSIAADGAMAINGEKVGGEYLEQLRRYLARRAPGDRLVFVAADDRAPYPRLVGALDGARRAGAETLALTTEPMPPAREVRSTRWSSEAPSARPGPSAIPALRRDVDP